MQVFSNTGKGSWIVNYLLIDASLNERSETMKEIPEWLRPLLPEGCLRKVDIEPYE